jgi:3-phosphoshikimate 1-carboxyvinyltransferase
MNIRPISPIRRPLRASVRVPGSKSLTNRALAIAALAGGTTTLANALFSDDSRHFVESLRRLGFSVDDSRLEAGQQVTLNGLGGRIPAAHAELFVGNAGTAARFLTAFVALGRGDYVIDGNDRMRQRPIGDLIEALNQLGVETDCPSGCPPVTVHASGLRGGQAEIAGDVSSQFLSGLLLAAPCAHAPLDLIVRGELNSKPYVDMTLGIMAEFGVAVEREGYARFCVNPQPYRANPLYAIESDASAASYFFAAPAICGGSVRVENISRRSKQGDVRFVDVLAQMGCTVNEGPDWIEVARAEGAIHESPLRGVDVDLRDIPDTAQTLAAVAPFAGSPTTLRGIASARLKETDRVAATCAELRRLGVRVEEYDDGLKIYPCEPIQPATVQTYDDHRMAMAFALIGLRVEGITIENPGCVSKTFPDYFEVLESLRSEQAG